MLAFYIPAGYYIDMTMWRRRERARIRARERVERSGEPRRRDAHGRPDRRELLPAAPRGLRPGPGRRPRRGGGADPRRRRGDGAEVEAILAHPLPLRPHRRRRAGGGGDRGAGLLPRDRGPDPRRHHGLRPLGGVRPVRELRRRRDGRAAARRWSWPGSSSTSSSPRATAPATSPTRSAARTRSSPATSSSRARSAASTCPAATGRRCWPRSAPCSTPTPTRPSSIPATWG